MQRLFFWSRSRGPLYLTHKIKETQQKIKELSLVDLEELQDEMEGEEEEDDRLTQLAKQLADYAVQKNKLIEKKNNLNIIDGEEEVKEFYDVFSNFDTQYPKMKLDRQQKLFNILVQHIEIEPLTPHWIQLSIHWLPALLDRPDRALVWRKVGGRDKWSDVEIELLHEKYHKTDILALLQFFPTHSYDSIRTVANRKGLRRKGAKKNDVPYPTTASYQDLAPNGEYLFGDLQKTVDRINSFSKIDAPLVPAWFYAANNEDEGAIDLSDPVL